jgi:hypothetical protein
MNDGRDPRSFFPFLDTNSKDLWDIANWSLLTKACYYQISSENFLAAVSPPSSCQAGILNACRRTRSCALKNGCEAGINGNKSRLYLGKHCPGSKLRLRLPNSL